MDDYDFLDSEQEEAIRQFFQNFSIERRTQLKEKFISLWDKLGDIYHGYRDNLAELGIAYEGMMYRYVMEELQPEKLKYDRYVFVGFNVLNKVETRFLSVCVMPAEHCSIGIMTCFTPVCLVKRLRLTRMKPANSFSAT